LEQHWKTLLINLREYCNNITKTAPISLRKYCSNSIGKTLLISLGEYCNNAGKILPKARENTVTTLEKHSL